MMKYNTPILTIFFILTNIFFFPLHSQAQETSFGLAMHGSPKYTAQDTHLSYVNPSAPKGDLLKMSAIGTFDNLNPFTIKGVAVDGLELGYDRLMRRVWDEPFTMYPLIAQSADIPDDRSSVTFHLNPKARFHDGSPVTAQDVLFSFETLREFGRPNMRRIYALADKSEIKNDHEIYFHFGEGHDRETVMIFSMMPILSKTWWSGRVFDATLTEIPLLNGPYKIASNEIGRKVVYERVSDYWAADLLVNKGLYNFNRISYDYYRDNTVALEALKKGDISLRIENDIAKWESSYADSPALKKITVPHQRPERAAGFVFNLRRQPFDDINVRKALILAFDYDWIGKNFFYDKMKPITSFYPNSILSAPLLPTAEELEALEPWKKDLKPAVFNAIGSGLFPDTMPQASANPPSMRLKLAQADQFLRQSGWIIENGKRVNAQTKTQLSFEILINTAQDERIAITYKSALQKLGIDLIIRMLDSSSFTERKINYNFDMISLFWQNTLSPGTEQMIYWSCNAANQKGSMNYSGICNPALDHFAAEVAQAKTYDSLKTSTHIIDRILLSEHILVPFFYKSEDLIAYQGTLQPPETTPIYGFVIESWSPSVKNEK